MLKASLKSLLAHKLRLALSGIAIVLGVAFVAGSLIFTDTLSRTFETMFQQTAADVTVSKKQAFDTNADGAVGDGIPAAVVDQVRKVDGVAAAEGQVAVDGVQIMGKDGKVVATQGPPTFGIDWSDTPGLSPLKIVEGRAPERAGEVAIDSTAAEKSKLRVGDSTRILTPTSPVQVTVVGVLKFGQTGNLNGATLTAFDRATAQKLLLKPGHFTTIAASATPGTTHEQLRDRIASAVGSGFAAKTQKEQADENAGDVKEFLKFFNVFLLIFAGIALFVGSFIILNTFSMLVAQRTRELALLRAVGANRRQVTRSVLIEALVLGVIGATLGLGLGLGLAVGLQALFAAFGMEIQTDGLVVGPRTVVWSYVVGVLVTLVAAYFPARRASKVPPIAAMRDDVAMPARSLHRRTVFGTVLTTLGLVALGLGIGPVDGSNGWMLVAAGAIAVLIGVPVLSPVLSRPVVRVLAAAFPRLFGTVGRLSRENALRNPRRTAATSSALMIGLALVGAISVLASSTNASVDKLVDNALGADFVVLNEAQRPFSAEIAEQLRTVPGVASVTQQRWTNVKVQDKVTFVGAIDPSTVEQAAKLDFVSGSAAGLADGGLLLSEPTAQGSALKVGDKVPLTFANGAKRDVTVSGIFKPNQWMGDHVVSLDTFAAGGGLPQDFILYLRSQPGADAASIQKALESKLTAHPNVAVKDQTGFKEANRKQVNQLLFLIYALLALSIVIAVLGIVNTLALSVIERTREVGLLRAVGMSRRQLRRMVRLESVVISVFGALLGLGIGVGFGVALQTALAEQGIEVLAVPVGSLAGFLVVAAVIGVLAAIWPARRAARLDILRAITTE